MNDHTNKGEGELGVLARRKIEAAIVAPIYDEMRQAIDEEKARDILRARSSELTCTADVTRSRARR